nr:extensin-like [Arachis hypogaea]
MGKKVIAKRAPREKIHKLPGYPRPSTRSQDPTFTPSPSPPTSPLCTAPMVQTKTTPRVPAPARPTPLPKAAPTKPTSSKPSSSKGKRPAVENPVPETTKTKPSDSLKYTDVRPCAYTSVKWDEGVGISYHDALAHICEHDGDQATEDEEEAVSKGNGSDA